MVFFYTLRERRWIYQKKVSKSTNNYSEIYDTME